MLIAGFALAAASLILGVLAAIPAIVVGILVVRRGSAALGGAIITLAVALPLTATVIWFAVLDARAFRVPSEAMEPTVKLGDRVVTTHVSTPKRGDILVFHPPSGADMLACGVRHSSESVCSTPTGDRSSINFIKRVAAVGGDRVSIRDGRVYIDGHRQDEPYIRPDAGCGICNLPREVTIPEGHYLMLGDNRGESADSREWGPIPKGWIIGKARLRYWPLGRFGSP